MGAVAEWERVHLLYYLYGGVRCGFESGQQPLLIFFYCMGVQGIEVLGDVVWFELGQLFKEESVCLRSVGKVWQLSGSRYNVDTLWSVSGRGRNGMGDFGVGM